MKISERVLRRYIASVLKEGKFTDWSKDPDHVPDAWAGYDQTSKFRIKKKKRSDPSERFNSILVKAIHKEFNYWVNLDKIADKYSSVKVLSDGSGRYYLYPADAFVSSVVFGTAMKVLHEHLKVNREELDELLDKASEQIHINHPETYNSYVNIEDFIHDEIYELIHSGNLDGFEFLDETGAAESLNGKDYHNIYHDVHMNSEYEYSEPVLLVDPDYLQSGLEKIVKIFNPYVKVIYELEQKSVEKKLKGTAYEDLSDHEKLVHTNLRWDKSMKEPSSKNWRDYASEWHSLPEEEKAKRSKKARDKIEKYGSHDSPYDPDYDMFSAFENEDTKSEFREYIQEEYFSEEALESYKEEYDDVVTDADAKRKANELALDYLKIMGLA